jgi:hypothetical protein
MAQKVSKEDLLATAKQFCDDNNKSDAFMLQYMQDFAEVELDDVLEYLENLDEE